MESGGVDFGFNDFKDHFDHEMLMNVFVPGWEVLIVLYVHPYFADTFAVYADVLLGNGEASV